MLRSLLAQTPVASFGTVAAVRILYVDVDTLRADHTGPYGYPRRITPNLDRLAADSVVFARCYCSDSPCAPSRAAWTSGQFGITTGAIANFGPASEIRMFDRTRHAPFFGGHLYRHGIHTTSISCFPERHLAYWYVGNFREWIKPSLSNGDDEDGQTVTDAAIEWLRRRGRAEDWLLQVHFWDPHTPYLESGHWVNVVAESGPAPDWPDEETIAAHADVYGPHTALDLYEGDGSWSVPAATSPNPVTMPDAITSRSDFVRLVNGYDGAIAYFDDNLGRLLHTLSELGILNETAVIVTSDHGECLGENGCYGDHPMANEASHHVPLIIRWPGTTEKIAPSLRRVEGLVYQLDLCPTVCDMLDIDIPPGWEGLSFAAALQGEHFTGRPYLMLSHGAYTYQRSVRTPEHLYLRTLHPGMWRIEREQLYAIEDDPHMTRDILQEDNGAAAHLAGLLEEWRRTCATMLGAAPDPMEARRYESPAEAFSVANYLQRLEKTGRSHLAADLSRRLAEPWVLSQRW